MKTITLSIWLGSAVLCVAQQSLVQYDWNQLAKSGELLGGAPTTVDGRTALLIQNTNDTPLQVQLLKIKKPPVKNTVYAIRGELKYERVQGDGYLEMWNFYPPIKKGLPEGQYFSRTLGVSGEMGKIAGTSNWRPFVLPFDRTGASGPPTRLELNLFLPGSGTVYLGPIELVEYPPGVSLAGATAPGAWWSDQTAGLVGGIGGAAIGCLASLLAWLASRGKARPLVTSTFLALIAFGGVLAVGGFLALIFKQPYGVWFPLVLGAALLLGILPARLRHFRKQYEELELRRMAAADTFGG